ncbi:MULTISPECIES: GIY-YIG nuclease family protein [unclassified Nostoc]|uniref:GIY-YIG nuclease family protein n=1 Tax=unclassified Nostoc TaxID=2593658 RepID=UPI002AD1F4C5|nr:GIY-YIG nuclease family protein [Nostoc sp. DedQUE03]MDZ7971551.1 GIY-YIG nuclease family protein [Nostoc sp. DedQUE03]MDZ8046228.1 GIY-YIG nuclease family protein [Nostoc sp. DedQUE02]
MKADEHILQLPHTNIKNRELLPEQSGIYYVLDEQFIVWYVGQAKNLRNRWAGDSHHRLYQLQKQRKKQFVIYYELIAESHLNAIERQRINEYNPQLNGTKIKIKKLHPTETLLRETLTILAPYSFVLGVEPPRKQDPKLINDSIYWRDNWRVQKAVLPLSVIHVCINLKELEEFTKDWRSVNRFLKQVFKQRPNYSDNWACKGQAKDEKFGIFFLRRLLVNGFAVEVYKAHEEIFKYIQGYKLAQLAGVNIRVVNESSLVLLKSQCLLSVVGIYAPSENQTYPYYKLYHQAIERLFPYKKDIVKLLFNENINTQKLQILPPVSKTIKNDNLSEESYIGLSARLANLAAKKKYLIELLTQRDVDLNCYKVNKYLETIPKDENYVDSNYDRRMTVYVKSFMYGDLRKPGHSSSLILGDKGQVYQLQNVVDCPYQEVYLAAKVDRAFWLLLEPYLSDFTKVKLQENEGYVNKHYFSARRVLVPAIMTITLNGKWKSNIPFGCNNGIAYKQVIDIIKNRLQESGIPKLRFSFKSESVRS